MPRKDKNKNENGMGEEKKGSTLLSLLFGIMIIAIWLIIFAVLIKFDVGGFGSSVMRPMFEDVPVVNKILPDETKTQEVAKEEYPYKSLAEAIDYIKKLETELEKYKSDTSDYTTQIADLEAEIARLKTFEESQQAFEEQKKEYYDTVVLGEDAPSVEEYKKYYEQINPEYAEELYQKVAEQYMYNSQYKELAEAYTAMKPSKAADAIYEMTGNLEIAVAILKNMESEDRAAILNALSTKDAVYCAKLTVLLAPQS